MENNMQPDQIIQSAQATQAPQNVHFVPQPYQIINSRHGLFMINENDRYIGQSFLHYGEYSYEEWLILESIMQLHPGNVLEIGANIGSHTLGMAKLAARQGYQVFAFEPQPIIHQQLCANLAINAVFNTETYPYACGKQKGAEKFSRLNPFQYNNFGGVGFDTAADDNYFIAQVVVLDEALEHLPNISLIKIDVEGMELEVLQGAQNILQKNRPILYVENDQVSKSKALIEFIQAQGYNLWWHLPQLYSNDNFFKNPNNIFQGLASFNMLCLPKESTIPVVNLMAVDVNAKHLLEKN